MADESPIIVHNPATFVSGHAVAFRRADGTAAMVDAANPLPVRAGLAQTTATAVEGSTSASGIFGPFAPELARPIWLTLSGSWVGTVSLLRSVDAGTTKRGLTVAGSGWASFSGNVNEIVGDESEAVATYYLAVTLTSGTLAYRVSQ